MTTTTVDHLLLDAYAARSCPVKTRWRFDPEAVAPPVAPDDLAAVRAETTHRHKAVVLEALIEACRGRVVDLRLLVEDGPHVQAAATRHAMLDRADVVVGAVLPVDAAGHRTGAPDLLVRGADRPDGGPGYHPIVLKRHHIVEATRQVPEGETPRALAYTTLVHPSPIPLLRRPGSVIRLRMRETDFRQLAHYHRMLEAAGFAGAEAWAGVIGDDHVADAAEPILAWTDLAEPVLRTYAPETDEGWRLSSVLERYDAALAWRLEIARAAAASEPSPVEPVVIRECATCPWWTRCRTRLAEDDVSLLVDRGAFDRREVEALRSLGLGGVGALAAADPDTFLPAYLPLVAHRSTAEARWRTARRRARMLVSGTDFARETDGPVEVPRAGLEIDFDLETAADGRIYLWGFWVERPAVPGSGRYVVFTRFADLDEAAETALAVEALDWLRETVRTEPSVAVYHYSSFEVTQLQTLAAREDDPVLSWAAAYAGEHFVDLLEIVKEHWFGVHGLGLKLIASHAGFHWRDVDPGGLNSQEWFADAVHQPDAVDREAARRRVLEYNEDDVRATRALRDWLTIPSS